MKKLTALDRLIGYFSPASALRRSRARYAIELINGARKYEGASKSNRTGGWFTSNSDANSALVSALSTLRNRSRDLVRNEGYAAKAVQVIVENTIGTGIVAKASAKDEAKVQRANAAWNSWADTIDCDVDALHDFSGLQALAMRAVVEGGEAIIRRVRLDSKSGASIPLKIQVLEGDYLDSSKNERFSNGGYVIQGVEFDKNHKRVAYWLFDTHPGDTNSLSLTAKSTRHDAADIIHLYRVDRPGQARGVPWAAPVIMALRDFGDYEEAQLIRQKIAACFSAFVYDSEPPPETGQGLLPIDRVEPGMIEHLPPGKDIKFASPPGVDGYSEYSKQMLHKISAGFGGITYEAMTGDFSQVNFSSGRMGWLEFQRNIEAWRWRMVIPRMCAVVWNWFTEAAALSGVNLQGVTPNWTPPRREMIDPVSETNTIISSIRGGMITLSEAIRQSGYDPNEVLTERAKDDAKLDELGITLDCDPRKITKAGMTQTDLVAQATADANQGNE